MNTLSLLAKTFSAACLSLLLFSCHELVGQQKTTRSKVTSKAVTNVATPQEAPVEPKAYFCEMNYNDKIVPEHYYSNIFSTDKPVQRVTTAFINYFDARYPERVTAEAGGACMTTDSGSITDVQAKRANYLRIEVSNNKCCQIPLPAQTEWSYSGENEALNARRQQAQDQWRKANDDFFKDRSAAVAAPSTTATPPIKPEEKKDDPCMQKWLAMVRRHMAIDYNQVCGKK